jgi:hypothetical protein
MARKRRVFEEETPLGYRVVLARDRWREIIRFKHPALAGHESEVRETVRDPDEIRASAKETDVHVFYRKTDQGYICVVVGRDDSQERFVVTAYFTAKIKKGDQLWTR